MKMSKEMERILELQKTETPKESITRRQLITVSRPDMLLGHRSGVNWAAVGSVEPAFAEAFGQAMKIASAQAREMDAAAAHLGIPKREARGMAGLVEVEAPDTMLKRSARVNWHAIGEVSAAEAEVFGDDLLAAASKALELDAEMAGARAI